MENLQESINKSNDLLVTVSDDNIANVHIHIEENELDPYKKHFTKEKQKNVVLRGYRKGKAPEEMVARYFKEEVRDSAKNNLIYVKYMKLLQEHRLQPLSEPQLNELNEEGGKIYASLTVEVLQPIVLGQYLGLEIQKMPLRSMDDDAKAILNEIKSKQPKLVKTDEPARNEQIVTIDFTMLEGQKELEKQEDLKINLGANLFFKDFEDKIIGMHIAETKEFSLHFPDNYPKEELKNKNINFVLKIKDIHNVSEYSDEELTKILGYDTLDKMMDSITVEVMAKQKYDEHLFYENQILGQLLAAHQFKLPKKLLDDEIKRILQEKPDMLQKEVEEVADRFMRTDLILRAIYERHPDIQFKKEEFDAKIVELAQKANDTVENTLQKLKDTNKLQIYLNYLANCKVIDFLIETADKKETIVPVINENNNIVIEQDIK